MNDNRRMSARLSAFVIWALVAATVVFWGLRLAVQPAAVPVHSVASADAGARADLARLLGVPPVEATVAVAAPEASSRFKLLGIMAPKHGRTDGPSHGGLALIAVDGKPARAFPVGAHLDADLVLRSVSLRTASIGTPQGAQTVLLEIPPLAAAATGTLPLAGSMPAPVVAPVPAVPPPVVAPAQAQPPAPSAPPRESGALTQ